MSSEFQKTDHMLTVSIFLGGATFAALFFLLQSKEVVQNYELLVFLTALASIVFILTAVGRMVISNGDVQSPIFERLVGLHLFTGLLLIFGILTLLIIEVNLVVGIIVGVVAVTLFIIFEVVSRK